MFLIYYNWIYIKFCYIFHNFFKWTQFIIFLFFALFYYFFFLGNKFLNQMILDWLYGWFGRLISMLILLDIIIITFPYFFAVFNRIAFDYTSHHSRFTKLNCHSYSNNRAIFAAGRHCYNVFFLYGKGIRIGNTFDLTARHYLDDIIFMLNQVEIFHCWWKLIERIIFKVEVNIGLSKLLHIRNDFLIKPSSIFIIFWNRPTARLDVLLVSH